MQLTKIFLVGLNVKFSEQRVFNFFKKKYNSSVEVKLVYKKTNQNKHNKQKRLHTGYGTISLSDKGQAEKLLAQGEFILDGRRFFSKPYLEGKRLHKFKNNIKNKRVFIHNVDPKMTNKSLRELFATFGEIEDAYLVAAKQGFKPRNANKGFRYGYVMYKHIRDAQKVVKRGTVKYQNSNIIVLPFQSKQEGGKNCSRKIKEETSSLNQSGNLSDCRHLSPIKNRRKKLQRKFKASKGSKANLAMNPNIKIKNVRNTHEEVGISGEDQLCETSLHKKTINNNKFTTERPIIQKTNTKGVNYFPSPQKTNDNPKLRISLIHRLASLWSNANKDNSVIRSIVTDLPHHRYQIRFNKENPHNRQRRVEKMLRNDSEGTSTKGRESPVLRAIKHTQKRSLGYSLF